MGGGTSKSQTRSMIVVGALYVKLKSSILAELDYNLNKSGPKIVLPNLYSKNTNGCQMTAVLKRLVCF